MKTKTLLLGAAAWMALAGAAQADEASSWYLGLEGGLNWNSEADLAFIVTTTGAVFNIDFDEGWSVFATAGYAFDDNWRVELEGAYRANDAWIGELTEWSLMLNARYEMPVMDSISLSLGAGLGYDDATFTPFFPIGEASDGTFAYQGIAGLNWSICDSLDLTLTYRYFVAQEPTFKFSGTPLTAAFDDISKHSLSLGLRYDL